MSIATMARWPGSELLWHQRVFSDSERTLCGLKLSAESQPSDEPPPLQSARCWECDLVLEEIEELAKAKRGE